MCLLVNANFLSSWAWLAGLPRPGWLVGCVWGFLWLISENDRQIVFRLASFVNLSGFASYGLFAAVPLWCGGGRESFTESLILAQDERWRRA